MDNAAGEQLFNEVVGTLSAAFSNYTNDPSKGNRISKIQGDQIGFAQAMAQVVEDAYQWKTTRGLEIVKTAILAIEYDEDTKELMKDVKKARSRKRRSPAFTAFVNTMKIMVILFFVVIIGVSVWAYNQIDFSF